MTVQIKDWYGRLELFFIVERWRDSYAAWNRLNPRLFRRVAVFIIDREFWESLRISEW